MDFKNTVLVMTSNIGSHALIDEKLSEAKKHEAVMETLRKSFRPEFLNRIDETVIFNSLGQEQISGIVKIQLEEVQKRMQDKKIKLDFDPTVLSYLAKKGYDPIYGARPLKRVIQNDILNPLAKEIISGKVKSGDQVKISADDLRVHFS